MENKIRRIPARYLKIAPQKITYPIRDSDSGRFEGRKLAKGNQKDSTRSVYLIHDYDIDHNGKIGPGEHGGVIRGRQNITVKASTRNRGYQRGKI